MQWHAGLAFGFAAAFALVFLVFYSSKSTTWPKSVIKTLSVLLLALAAQSPWLLVLGLFACSVGDFFLSREGDQAFLIGMASFAIGHVLYVVLFASIGAEIAVLPSTVFLVFGFFMIALLWHKTGSLRWPVGGYICIICTMCVFAVGLPNAYVLALFGALLFAVSDTILAAEKYLMPKAANLRKFAPYLIWTTYWVAQALIVAGITLT